MNTVKFQRTGRTHLLKIHPEFFRAQVDGTKRFEIRKDDRLYTVGDLLQLNEWDPKLQDFTGKRVMRVVTYIVKGGHFGIDPEYVVMGTAAVENT